MAILPLSRSSSQDNLFVQGHPASSTALPSDGNGCLNERTAVSSGDAAEKSAVLNVQEAARIRAQMEGLPGPKSDAAIPVIDLAPARASLAAGAKNNDTSWRIGESLLWALSFGYYQGGRDAAAVVSEHVSADASASTGAEKKDPKNLGVDAGIATVVDIGDADDIEGSST